MLLNNLYQIVDQKIDVGNIQATITFNAGHPIFQGHFPGQPIVPGVCMVEIVREMIQDVAKTSIRIVAADNIKFLNVIDPSEKKAILVDIHYRTGDDDFEIAATLQHESIIYFKFKGMFQKV